MVECIVKSRNDLTDPLYARAVRLAKEESKLQRQAWEHFRTINTDFGSDAVFEANWIEKTVTVKEQP